MLLPFPRLRWILGAFAALILIPVVIYWVLVSRAGKLLPHAFTTGDGAHPLVIAHQGGDGERPSNTLLAFSYAVGIGADVLDLDVHGTRDGVLVVIHDDTVDRTTDGTGRVQDFTFEALQQLDAGYDWPTLEEESTRTDRPYRGQGLTIPSLEAVLESFPNARYGIEIKQREPSIVTPFCEMLRRYGLTERTVVSSFHPQTMTEFRAACPEVMNSLVEPEVRPFFFLSILGMGDAYPSPAHALQVPVSARALGLNFRVVQPMVIEAARRKGMVVYPWTINSEAEMRQMLAYGVDGINTDYPARLLAIMGG
jgi:glycerophosphoryl diester phosphodiesterase